MKRRSDLFKRWPISDLQGRSGDPNQAKSPFYGCLFDPKKVVNVEWQEKPQLWPVLAEYERFVARNGDFGVCTGDLGQNTARSEICVWIAKAFLAEMTRTSPKSRSCAPISMILGR